VSPLSLLCLLNPPESSSCIVMTSEASLEAESLTARLDCLIRGLGFRPGLQGLVEVVDGPGSSAWLYGTKSSKIN
jgi:hypothetical protein